MKLSWAKALDLPGVGFGYTTHQKRLHEALEKEGVEFTDDADIAISIVPAGNFHYVPGKFNILYTMYEMTTIPDNWIPKVQQADLVVVPCRQNREVFRQYTDKPVEICWEGVETDKFAFVEREFPKDRPFTFLWFGASNARKGYEHMVVAWHVFRTVEAKAIQEGKVRLLMKTTQIAKAYRVVGYDHGIPIRKTMPVERMFAADEVIVDTRRLPVIGAEYRLPLVGEDVSEVWTDDRDKWPGLAQMYAHAHAFCLPSMGEGFGLTLAEAMSTGLPCIYTNWGGPRDFISTKEGYPLPFHWAPVTAQTPQADGTMKPTFKGTAASIDPLDLVKKMQHVYYNYERALVKGRRAAERIRRDITWQQSARSFMDIVRRYTEKAAVA